MFEGFRSVTIDAGQAHIHVRQGGAGPPLLLLHGYPQTSAMWGKIAPDLAREFTVVAPDLRGYGASSKPATAKDHEPYSKRAMARDQMAVMAKLGFSRFFVAGHDRGGRVGYRLALDHPEAVAKLAVLDIVPTGEAYARANRGFGFAYWHWFFLPQPAPLPENAMAADPEHFFPLRGAFHDPEALAEYRRWVRDPATMHAMCEDYRAGATFDFRLDQSERGKKKIACPVLALWGAKGALPHWYDVLGVWRDWAGDVSGEALDCGHFLPEEKPEETLAALRAFFRA
jgi:haloacetate dehalogenase